VVAAYDLLRQERLSCAAQQEDPGGQRLVEREPGELRAIFDQPDPVAGPEALVTGGLG
jgi:hypothetical protein